MAKPTFRAIGATTYLSPLPVVLLGCADPQNGLSPNLITIGWTGIVCSKPPMLTVSIRKERYSHDIVARTGEFSVNLCGEDMVKAVDFCGVKSGRDLDKFAATGLTAIPAEPLAVAPAVAQAPAYLSCKVESVTELGTHDMFLASIVDVHVRDEFFTPSGAIDERAMKLVGYVHGQYRALAGEIGFFGFSVASPEALKRREKRGNR